MNPISFQVITYQVVDKILKLGMIKVGVSNWSSKKSVMKLLRFESHLIMFYYVFLPFVKRVIFEPKKSCIINGLRLFLTINILDKYLVG